MQHARNSGTESNERAGIMEIHKKAKSAWRDAQGAVQRSEQARAGSDEEQPVRHSGAP
jgi:hypothetical protein